MARRRRGLDVDPQVVAEPRDRRRSGPARRRRSWPRPGRRTGRRASSPPKQRRRQVQHVAVDQARPVEVAGDGGPALDHDLQDAAAAELVEHVAEVAARARGPGGPGRRRGAVPSTTRSGSRPVDVADGERGVVGPHRAGADDDGVALGPQAVGVGPGLRAGDPLATCRRARRCARRAWRPASARPRGARCGGA